MKYISIKKISYFLSTLFLCIGLWRLYNRLTDDFRLTHIHYDYPFKSSWQLPLLSENEKKDLMHIFAQPFTYLGKGAQCYAFESADHLYVIKFFKFKHLKPSPLLNIVPPIYPFKSYKKRCEARKKRKLVGVLTSYDQIFQEDREAAGLIYVHLTCTPFFHSSLTLIDKIGLRRQIDLDNVVFLLQKKGETLQDRLDFLLNSGQVEKASKTVTHLLDMYIAEYHKGFIDYDHGVMQNTGFIGDEPFHLDVGKVIKDDRIRSVDNYKKDLKHVIWKIYSWIKKEQPYYSVEFTQLLQEYYSNAVNEPLILEQLDGTEFKHVRLY